MWPLAQQAVPYCRAPPNPDELLARWNLDPVLIATLLLIIALYEWGAWRLARHGRIGSLEPILFRAGWIVGSLALISPLCALSVSLFAARVGQHMILTLVAAPLIMAGQPMTVFAALRRSGARRRHGRRSTAPLAAAGVFAALLWFWHAPAPYQATFDSPLVYWTMHVTMIGSALWLWAGLLDRVAARTVSAIMAGVVSALQMGFLGALITLAPRPAYVPHFLTTAAWGLSPLQDQQLGGVLMWVPGCVVFLAVAMIMLRLLMARVGVRGAA
jgi:putative membrane protein